MRAKSLTIRLFSVITALAVAIGCFLAWKHHRASPHQQERGVSNASPGSSWAPPDMAASTGPKASGSAIDVAEAGLASLLKYKGYAPEDRLAVLNELFRRLDLLSYANRRVLFRNFFASGRDVSTGLPFRIGVGGWLVSWPSLRVALLDYAGRVDPILASELAEGIYASSSVPDEWAIALRDEARSGRTPAESAQLTSHLQTYLANQTWSDAPTFGYLEGFDVAVYARRTDLIGQLAALTEAKIPNATRFAAFLALDRLMLADPVGTLTYLNQNPGCLAGQSQLRAELVARADVRDSAQRRLIESYFMRADIASGEREAFVASFPNENLTTSTNLLTPPPSQTIADMQSEDLASLAALKDWRSSGRFQSWDSAMASTERRLTVVLHAAGR